jgi:TRIAD3 protein (E3 ubiquitin-protein ligase RNF216)
MQFRDPTPPAIPGSPQVPNHQLTPPVEYIQPGHKPQPPATAEASEVVRESHERLVERVREVVPDVLPAHVFKLLSTHEDTFFNNLLDVVIHILLEDRSYPKDIKGKAKARAAEKETEESPGDIRTNMDYTLLDANRRLGSVYQSLSLVCFDFPFFRTLLICMVAIPPQEFSLPRPHVHS